ncbi:MAG: GPP34 family phosphoprotein [Pseudonocardiaceae bacterium]|nr:GPP34 family phosphoprotein [Pseudonocardiaceae bacterium]
MRPSQSLPTRLYLLAYDTRKRRLTARDRLGFALRAAALADLLLHGWLRDDSGKAVLGGAAAGRSATSTAASGAAAAELDPVLASILHEIERSRPRRWQHWVRKNSRRAAPAVRDQLAAARVIKVEKHRILGTIPHNRITVRDTRKLNQLSREVARAAHGSRPVARLDPATGALAAIAAAAEFPTVFSMSQRWKHRRRIAELNQLAAPVLAALRIVIRQRRSAASSEG